MRNTKGFTLVELVITVAILLALSTIAVVSVTNVLKTSNKNINKIQQKLLESALKAYAIENCSENGSCSVDKTELRNYIDSKGENIKDEDIPSTITLQNGEITYSFIEFKNDNTNPWKTDNRIYQSKIESKKNTTTTIKFKFTITKKSTLTFDWAVSSELKYDKIYYTIKRNGITILGTGTSTQISGNSSITNINNLSYTKKTISLTTTGDYELSFTYYKDSSQDRGLDSGFVKNVNIT